MSTPARRIVLSTIVICAWAALMPALSNAQVGDANLSVQVRDASAAVVPGATIEVVAQATGLQRTAVTGGEGTVTIAHLPPGRYRVSVSLSGFTTQVQDVTLLIGQTADVSYQLAPSSISETVEVTGGVPMIETNNATLHKVITPEEVQSLPINGRDFSTLATLVPGVTQGNTSENKNFDPVKRNLPAISINGQSGRNIDVLLDGGDNTDIQIGGQNIALSLEAVQEFEVITHDPKTQFNRGIGGVLNVVTKSGTNDVSGSAFGFFRDKALQSIDAISAQLDKPKPPFSQQQFGGTLGGPIKTNGAFYFVSYERQRRNTSRVFNSGGAFAALDGTVTEQPFTQNFFLGKVNGRLTSSHNWMLRYAEQDNDSGNEFFSDSDAPGSTASVTNRAHDLVASLTSILGTNRVNDLRFHYQWYENSIRNDVSSLELPTLIFPAGTFGASQAGSQSPHQTTWEVRDDFSWTRGRHDIRIGGSLNYQPATGIKGDFRHNRFLFANNDYDPATNTIGPTNTVLNYRSWMSPGFYV
ncbi:MAG: PEGA domain-containing protein, partial [Acidobacteria bacterium]